MTEMITGVDLIQEQIRAAQGHKLKFTQEEIQIKVEILNPKLTPQRDQACPGHSAIVSSQRWLVGSRA